MTTAIAPKLSLFDIEIGWVPLLEARADAEEIADPAERAEAIENADVAIAAHAEKEVAKADSYIGICRFLESVAAAAKSEEQRQARRRQVADNILRQIKATGLCALQASNRKRIDGTRGSLSIRGNGGVQPLVITDAALLPPECCRMEGWISADLWVALVMGHPIPTSGFSFNRVPDNAAIRAKLLEDCGTCGGSGGWGAEVNGHPPCESCGGTGKNAVPGAYLGERGSRLQIT